MNLRRIIVRICIWNFLSAIGFIIAASVMVSSGGISVTPAAIVAAATQPMPVLGGADESRMASLKVLQSAAESAVRRNDRLKALVIAGVLILAINGLFSLWLIVLLKSKAKHSHTQGFEVVN